MFKVGNIYIRKNKNNKFVKFTVIKKMGYKFFNV